MPLKLTFPATESELWMCPGLPDRLGTICARTLRAVGDLGGSAPFAGAGGHVADAAAVERIFVERNEEAVVG